MKKETGKKTAKKVVKKSDVKTAKKPETKKVEKVEATKVVEKKIVTPKKSSDKRSKYVSLGLLVVGVLLIILGIAIEKAEIPLKIIGVLVLIVDGLINAIKSKEHALIKSVGVMVLAALLCTWLLPYGNFSGSNFTDLGMSRVGFGDLSTILYYSTYFCLDKVIYLFVLAGFYALLSKTEGYKKIVNDIADSLKDHKVAFAVITMAIFVFLTMLSSQTLAVVFFIPFFISILSKLKFDKLSALTLTFGGVLSGMVGSPWGTEGLHWFNYYAGTSLQDGFTLRLIVEACVIVLLVVTAIIRLKKNEKNDLEVVEDVFEVGDADSKTKKLPMIIILAIMAVVIVLGYVDWETNFGIKAFNDFHTWLIGLTIGEDTTIFSFILGKAAVAFGKWDVATLISFLIFSSIIVALVNHIKVTDFLTTFGEGMKKMIIPAGLYMSVFVVFVIAYTSPFIPTITNWVSSLSKEFNPYLSTVLAFITSLFHADFGFTGYSVGGYLASAYTDKVAVVQTIYSSMYGLVQLVAPTSGLLLLGLGFTKVEYKTWLKYVWKFAVALFVILLIIFTIATYA